MTLSKIARKAKPFQRFQKRGNLDKCFVLHFSESGQLLDYNGYPVLIAQKFLGSKQWEFIECPDLAK